MPYALFRLWCRNFEEEFVFTACASLEEETEFVT